MLSIDDIAARFEGHRKIGDGFVAFCPTCQGPLKIMPTDAGGVAFRCKGGKGCVIDKIMAAVGLTTTDVMPMKPAAAPAAKRAEIDALADAAEPEQMSTEPQDSGGKLGFRRQDQPMDPYKPFPTDIFPGDLQRAIETAADSMGCDPAMVGAPMLPTLSATIGDSRVIRLNEGWAEPSVIWMMVIAPSGSMKSPAIGFAVDPLHDIQAIATRDHMQDRIQHDNEVMRYEADLAAWKRPGKNDYSQDPPTRPIPPSEPHFIISDTTIEGLAAAMANNSRLLLHRDELSGWVRSFNKYSKGGGDLEHWQAIFRAKPLRFLRKSAPTIYVPRAGVSIVGSIQPGVVELAFPREYQEDGLLGRILKTQPPQQIKQWTGRGTPQAHRAALRGVYEKLISLDSINDQDGNPAPRECVLSGGALEVWGEWYNQIARDTFNTFGNLQAAYAKLECYAARFALVIHHARLACGERVDPLVIDAQSMRAGVTMARWFQNEADRIYGRFGQTDDQREQHSLAEWIRRRGGTVTARDLVQGYRPYRNHTDAAEVALQALADAGYGAIAIDPPGPAGGRPTSKFRLSEPVYVYETPANPGKNVGSVDMDNVDAPEINTPDEGKPPAPDQDLPDHDDEALPDALLADCLEAQIPDAENGTEPW